MQGLRCAWAGPSSWETQRVKQCGRQRAGCVKHAEWAPAGGPGALSTSRRRAAADPDPGTPAHPPPPAAASLRAHSQPNRVGLHPRAIYSRNSLFPTPLPPPAFTANQHCRRANRRRRQRPPLSPPARLLCAEAGRRQPTSSRARACPPAPQAAPPVLPPPDSKSCRNASHSANVNGRHAVSYATRQPSPRLPSKVARMGPWLIPRAWHSLHALWGSGKASTTRSPPYPAVSSRSAATCSPSPLEAGSPTASEARDPLLPSAISQSWPTRHTSRARWRVPLCGGKATPPTEAASWKQFLGGPSAAGAARPPPSLLPGLVVSGTLWPPSRSPYKARR